MPKLSRMLGPTATLTIEVPGDEPLVVEYRRAALTPRLQARMQDFARQAADAASDVLPGAEAMETLCDTYASMLVSWNLTDEDGTPIGVDAASLHDVSFGILNLVMDAIRAETTVDPTSGEPSPNGSRAMGDSAPHLITSGSS